VSVPAHVSLVTLGVRDVQESAAFYERLGWHRSSASQDVIAFFATGTVAIGLYGHDALADDASVPADPPPRYRGVTLAINVASEAEVDRVLAEAEAAGASIPKPAQRADWGGYSGYFADSDGHLWEVAYNPGFPLNADGSVTLPD
jgi:hypothetical protein